MQAWCDYIAPVFTIDIAPHADLTASIGMTIWYLNELILGWVDAPAQHLERSDRQIAQQGLDHVLLQFYETGRSRVETKRHTGTVECGQVVIFDLTQPVRIEAEAVKATSLMIPRALLSDEIGIVEVLHGRAFDYDSDPVRRLLYTYLRGLIDCVDALEPMHLHGVVRAAAKLCGACFRQQDDLRRVADTEANLSTDHIGDVLLGTVSAPAQRLERPVRKIAQQGVDHILIQFYTEGEARVEVGRRTLAVKPRQMVIFDLSQPVATVAKAVSATNIMVPRALLADHMATIESLHGQALDDETEPLRRLFATYLTGLLACAEAIDARQARFVSQAIAKHCGACFQPGEGAARATEQFLGLAIRQFIEADLASEALGVDAICARFGISRATLYRLFEFDGGVASYIRERRLLRAIRLFTTAGGRPRVSTVAYATGFSDEKTFSRGFQRRFGFLPREAKAGNAVPRNGNENDLTLFAWMKTLAA